MFLNKVIFLKGFLSLHDNGFTSFLLIHPLANFKNFEFESTTLIFDPKIYPF